VFYQSIRPGRRVLSIWLIWLSQWMKLFNNLET